MKEPFAEIEIAAPVLAAAAALSVPLDLAAELAGVEDAPVGLEAEDGGRDGVGMGAEEAPLISCWMDELKVPVMPDKVNLAEKASALNPGVEGFW